MSLIQTMNFGRSKYNKLRDNLVLYYKLDNSVTDYSARNDNGIASNISYTSGIVGDAAYFNNSSIRAYNLTDFNFGDGAGNDIPFSISFWVSLAQINSVGAWFINKRANIVAGDEWQFLMTPTGLDFTKFGYTSTTPGEVIQRKITTYNPLPSLNTWYHLVYTDDGSKNSSGMNFYVNGTLLTSSDGSFGTYQGIQSYNQQICIGMPSWSAPTNFNYNGLMDEIGIWKNRCLTQADITQLYNSGAGNSYPFK